MSKAAFLVEALLRRQICAADKNSLQLAFLVALYA
jgi:hypothetical protein